MSHGIPTPTIVFFGTDQFSVGVLSSLEKHGFAPSVIVTMPDRPAGRKLIPTPPPAKIWALERNIHVLQPEKLDEAFQQELVSIISKDIPTKTPSLHHTLFIVASYGAIIPKAVLAIPEYGTLNVHPSLLPKLRGASPIETAIAADMSDTGISIMLMDEKMDHGPILIQEPLYKQQDQATNQAPSWPPDYNELASYFAERGGELLSEVIPKWIAGEITPNVQDDSQATYTAKIHKEDAEINLADDARTNLLKIRAYHNWPRAYFFLERGGRPIRIIITKAHLSDIGALVIDRIIPEGKREMDYKAFVKEK